jgi:formamidopyrimidine-DNA glycosylase
MIEKTEMIIMKDYLKSKLENKIILNWVFLKGFYKQKKPIGFVDFEKKKPLIVENILSKGTLIYIILFNENGYFYIIHNLKSQYSKWQDYEDDDCSFFINIGSTSLLNTEKLWFSEWDTKFLSTLQFSSKETVLEKYLNKIGIDIISDEFRLEKWKSILHKYQNKNIIYILTNNSIISGLDNLIISEVLYYAKISPLKYICNLSILNKDKLFEALRIVPRILYNKTILSDEDFENNIQIAYGDPIKIYEKIDSRRLVLLNSSIIYWDPKIQI